MQNVFWLWPVHTVLHEQQAWSVSLLRALWDSALATVSGVIGEVQLTTLTFIGHCSMIVVSKMEYACPRGCARWSIEVHEEHNRTSLVHVCIIYKEINVHIVESAQNFLLIRLHDQKSWGTTVLQNSVRLDLGLLWSCLKKDSKQNSAEFFWKIKLRWKFKMFVCSGHPPPPSVK